jgi:hypothetical protein
MTFDELEQLGREQLSSSFFMREFLYSEISQIKNIPNIPHYPETALMNGQKLCSEVLEPIQDKFGRLSIRSGYRSPEINNLGAANKNKYKCASNQRNYSKHIWDYPDSSGFFGAMTCIVVPSYLAHYQKKGDWQTLAKWIEDNIPEYSEMTFHPKLCAFNVSWHERPKKKIRSYIRSYNTTLSPIKRK